MLKQIKKAAMDGVMKVMSNPSFGKVMSDPRVMSALTKTFEVVSQVRGRMDEHLKGLAERLNLATKDDVSALSQKLGEVESNVDQLESRLEAEPAARRSKKKTD